MGPTSELIRQCAPSSFEEWEKFYFNNAEQKKTQRSQGNQRIHCRFGTKTFVKLSEVVQNELESINEEECIDYAYNLVLNRTYEGYRTEIDTIYGQLQSILGIKIHPAPDEWDRTFNVDFYLQVDEKYIGLQIKPISSGQSLNQYQWATMHETNHERFRKNLVVKFSLFIL